jgi:uncharacterized protein (TIGR00159 family)
MGQFWNQFLIHLDGAGTVLSTLWFYLRNVVDIGLVLTLVYVILLIIGERRTLWMVRGFLVLMVALALSRYLNLPFLSFFLLMLIVACGVAMAGLLQSEFRRFLEQLGRGEIMRLLQPERRNLPRSTSFTDEIVDAVRELSQNRIGALMILETDGYIDEQDFSVPGVKIDAEISKELIQTVFQTSTLLHDGAMLIRDGRVAAAGVILPLSERVASRQLGTRHRAAMGITERMENCICIVVSEETGSISLAEGGILNRPLTSSKLKELLEGKFAPEGDRVQGSAPSLRAITGGLKKRLANWRSKLPWPFRRRSRPPKSEG